jgi:hypothetical protein
VTSGDYLCFTSCRFGPPVTFESGYSLSLIEGSVFIRRLSPPDVNLYSFICWGSSSRVLSGLLRSLSSLLWSRFTLSSITESAFYQCSALEPIAIPSSVTTFDHECFGGCRNLVAVIFVGRRNYRRLEAMHLTVVHRCHQFAFLPPLHVAVILCLNRRI